MLTFIDDYDPTERTDLVDGMSKAMRETLGYDSTAIEDEDFDEEWGWDEDPEDIE